jgi:hypothetical protein
MVASSNQFLSRPIGRNEPDMLVESGGAFNHAEMALRAAPQTPPLLVDNSVEEW